MAYTVRYERDESGWWVAEVPEVKGCLSQGRTLRQARERIRDALTLFVDDAETSELVDDIRLPADGKRAVKAMEDARAVADHAAKVAAERASATVRVLTRELGISVRDAAEVLGLSHQRIHQLVHSQARVKGALVGPKLPRRARAATRVRRS